MKMKEYRYSYKYILFYNILYYFYFPFYSYRKFAKIETKLNI